MRKPYRSLAPFTRWLEHFLALSRYVTAILALLTVAYIFYGIWSWAGYEVNAQMGYWVERSEFFILLTPSILVITTYVALSVWCYRALANCQAFSHSTLNIQPWTAPFCFFVPIANLWMSYQLMLEIWNVSEDPRLAADRAGSRPVTIWWASLLLIMIFQSAVTVMIPGIARWEDYLLVEALSLCTIFSLFIMLRQLIIISRIVTERQMFQAQHAILSP